MRQQQLADRVRHFVGGELVAAAGREHGIEHQRHVGIIGDDLRDGGDALEASQHADLERVHRHVLEQAARLVGDPLGLHCLDSLDAERVLHGDRGDDRQRMAAHAGERQDVGLQAGAARRVRRGERQHDGRKFGFGVGGHGEAAGNGGSEEASGDARGARRAARLARIARFYSNGPCAMKKYMCLICGWIYDEAVGAPDEGIPPGTKWEDVPPNWTCPECGARKEDFELVEF